MSKTKIFLSEILACVGKPYSYGSTGPDSFDCSGLIQPAAMKAGLADFPRVSSQQWSYGQEITRDELAEGDLVFFDFAEPPKNVKHVGVYIGNGRMVNAQSQSPPEVCEVSIDSGYWSRRVIGYRRILDSVGNGDGDLIESSELIASASDDIAVKTEKIKPKKKPTGVMM